MTPQFGMVVVYVKDLTASKRFYAEVLGLRVEREAPGFVQFDRFALATDERLAAGKEPEIYWLVDDAEAALRELQDKTKIEPALVTKPFGKVFGVRDPDGGTRLLLELARNRPSKAV
jgi:catechol 2,3-dioxygenase-like lactoylglutathione lyase family enzyme